MKSPGSQQEEHLSLEEHTTAPEGRAEARRTEDTAIAL